MMRQQGPRWQRAWCGVRAGAGQGSRGRSVGGWRDQVDNVEPVLCAVIGELTVPGVGT